MSKTQHDLSRRTFALASGATVALGASLLNSGCSDAADLLLKLIKLLKDSFSLSSGESVAGDLVVSNSSGQPQDIEVVIKLKDDQGNDQGEIQSLIRIPVSDATWTRSRPSTGAQTAPR